MKVDKNKLKKYLALANAGFWDKEDGELNTDEHSLGIVLQRVHQKLSPGVVFICHRLGKTKRQACLAWRGQQHTLARGQDMADTIFNAALKLPGFLRNNPECAANHSGTHTIEGSGPKLCCCSREDSARASI